MLSEPRTISLITELIHLPAAHAAERLRDVYNEVCRTCGYENFTRLPGGARIERRDSDEAGFSRLQLLTDRIELTEDHTGATIEQFGQKVLGVLAASLPRLGIQILLVHSVTVRVTAAPHGFRSAGEFLARALFNIRPEDLEPLGRPTSVFGFRLVFPPTQEHPQNFNVRIETYVRDQRSLYIENVGTFQQPVQPGDLAPVERNLRATASFLADRVLPFLSRFDRRTEES